MIAGVRTIVPLLKRVVVGGGGCPSPPPSSPVDSDSHKETPPGFRLDGVSYSTRTVTYSSRILLLAVSLDVRDRRSLWAIGIDYLSFTGSCLPAGDNRHQRLPRPLRVLLAPREAGCPYHQIRASPVGQVPPGFAQSQRKAGLPPRIGRSSRRAVAPSLRDMLVFLCP